MDPESQARLAIVLVEARNPLNIGAAARAMSNFGYFDLRLVQPYDVAYREAVSAVGAGRVLEKARVFDTVAAAVADCALVAGATGLGHREFAHPLHRLEPAGRLLRRHLGAARAALLFGSEKFGLSNHDMAHCHWLLHVPTRAEHDSMNLGQAVAVCLYELARQPAFARPAPAAAALARAEDVERVTTLLEEALHSSGYSDYSREKSSSDKTRRLVRRLMLRSRDAEVLTGMLRQILWKLKSPGGG